MASYPIPPPTPSANLIDVPRTLMFETPHPASAIGTHKTAQPENVLSPQLGAKYRLTTCLVGTQSQACRTVSGCPQNQHLPGITVSRYAVLRASSVIVGMVVTRCMRICLCWW